MNYILNNKQIIIFRITNYIQIKYTVGYKCNCQWMNRSVTTVPPCNSSKINPGAGSAQLNNSFQRCRRGVLGGLEPMIVR